MKKYQVSIVILLVSLATFFIIYHFYYRKPSWKKYYQEHKDAAVRPLLLKAFSGLQPSVGIALDLGAGNGHETFYLLDRGWKVYAIDAQKKSRKIIEEQAQKENLSKNLFFLQTDFESIDWHSLPTFDLIIASYSLPFVKPEIFTQLWYQIIEHLKPGSILIANLFPLENKNFSASMMQSMTFLSEEQINKLLKPLFIHYLKKDNDTFDIIAVKK
ncbi:MAG: class I SAM-dependent methyltransferase [Candidatus Babeliales bacterium]